MAQFNVIKFNFIVWFLKKTTLLNYIIQDPSKELIFKQKESRFNENFFNVWNPKSTVRNTLSLDNYS